MVSGEDSSRFSLKPVEPSHRRKIPRPGQYLAVDPKGRWGTWRELPGALKQLGEATRDGLIC